MTEGNKKSLLGPKWYQRFWKRNCHIIESKATQKFSKDCSEWSVYHNFTQMYDKVYDAMVEAGVAKKLDKPKWVDVDGNEGEEAQTFRKRKATHTLTRPNMVVFVDEVACNTSQVGDGHVGGQKKLFQGVLYQKRQQLQITTTLPCWALLLQLENL